MNKKGFTLMELLVVIVIVAVVSVGATISFGTVDDNTAIKERINQFKEIQRSANLYLDLNDQATINQFISDGSIPISFTVLASENYISKTIEDPVTGDILVDMDQVVDNENDKDSFYVLLYINKENGISKKVSSCIVKKNKNRQNPSDKYYICVAGEDGIINECGNCPLN